MGKENDIDDELRAHLAMAIRERIERGEDPKAAEIAARREFGNRALVHERTREVWAWTWLEQIWQDTRYALRGLRASPGFTAVAILSLALGVGANTAIFSLMHTVMLRSLPVSQPGQLVELLQKYPGEPRGNGYWTFRSYEQYRDNNHVFSALIGTGIDNQIHLQPEGRDTDIAVGEFVTPNYFSELGLRPALGRLIGPENSAAPDTAVLSWTYWDAKYHRDPAVIGRKLMVQDKPVTVIGIAPKQYVGLRVDAKTSIWLPSSPDDRFSLLGRLKPGTTMGQARAEMDVLYRFTIEERAAASTDGRVRELRVELEPARAGLSGVRDRFGKPLTMLMAVVAILLLLACANLAGLLVARSSSRAREIAMRIGLGASRARIMRQLLTEALILATAGAVASLGVAYYGTTALLGILASARPHERALLEIHPDATTLAFVALVTLAAGLAFGLLPAWSTLRIAPAMALRQSVNSTQTRANRLLGKTLLAAQVALSVLLLSTGSLFVVHLQHLRGADLGFRRDNILVVDLNPAGRGYSGERLAIAYQQLIGRLKAIPGVAYASLSAPTPISGAGASGMAVVAGYQERPQDRRWISISWVGPQYFETLGIPVLAGRQFDFQEQSRVAIINQTLAKHYFNGRNPIGQTITMDHVTLTREPSTYEIVGVTADANYLEIREKERRAIYFPAFQRGRANANTLLVQTRVDPMSLSNTVRTAVRETAPNIPITAMTTLSTQIDASIVPERLLALLSGLFAVLGAVLAGIGIYGLLAYTVARRTNEIGVRLALGAEPSRIAGMVVSEAIAIVGTGLLIGLPSAAFARKLATAILPDLTPGTITPLALGAAVILIVASTAAYIPARRAATVDPMVSLRHE